VLENEKYIPFLTGKLPASEEIIHLIKFNCIKGCKTNKCCCKLNNIVCSEMCNCHETCENVATFPPAGLHPSYGSDGAYEY
jgi:hypothetical protein